VIDDKVLADYLWRARGFSADADTIIHELVDEVRRRQCEGTLMPELQLRVEQQLTTVPKPVQFCVCDGNRVIGCISYEAVKAAVAAYEEGIAAYCAAYPWHSR
jgi:hypothetical protein